MLSSSLNLFQTCQSKSFNSSQLLLPAVFPSQLFNFFPIFIYLFSSSSKNVTIQFARRTDVMPPAPLETKHHPSAVDLLLIKRLAAETSKESLLQFLQHEFVNIGKSYAERLIGMYAILNPFFHIWMNFLCHVCLWTSIIV